MLVYPIRAVVCRSISKRQGRCTGRSPGGALRQDAMASLVEAEHARIIAGLGTAVERRRRLQLDVELACRSMEGALDLALVRVPSYRGLELQPRPHCGPVRAVAVVLTRLAIARQLQPIHDDQVPGVLLASAGHRVHRRPI